MKEMDSFSFLLQNFNTLNILNEKTHLFDLLNNNLNLSVAFRFCSTYILVFDELEGRRIKGHVLPMSLAILVNLARALPVAEI